MTSETRVVSEDFYVDVFENAPDMICSVDLEAGTITHCNRTYLERLGYEREAVIGESPIRFYAEGSRETVRDAYDRLGETGEIANVEVRMETREGEAFDASLSATAVHEDGEIVASRSVIRDISDLKETERELREQTERLEQSNRELEQFAYLASHDLQEPLRMVASYTQLLARRYGDELDEKAQRYIAYAVEGAERMKALINDLLTYSRVNRPDGEWTEVDLEEVMEVVAANLKLKIEETGADLQWGELPTISGDETLLVQLFQNLVENALKFRGEDLPQVRVEAEEGGGEVRLTVEDNGIGFDPKNADRIFQIFQRLHERGEYDGTGTGLAIVEKVVDFHGGEVEVDSEVGVGTTFAVTLPN